MAIDNEFGKGIGLAAGFDLGAQKPLDARIAVNTIAERDAHVENNRAYEGMIVYVSEDGKNYQLVKKVENDVETLEWQELAKPELDRIDALEAMLNGGEGAEGGALGTLQDNIDAVNARLNQGEGGDVDLRIAQAESDIDGLQGLVGQPAQGENAATGLHGALEELETSLTETMNTNKSDAEKLVNAEKVRAEAAEDLLDKAIDAEVERAEGAEADLQDAIDTEKERAEGKEEELNQAILDEKVRAEGVEQGLQNAINAINNEENGILAQAKALDKADRDDQALVDQEQDRRLKALEDANAEGGAVKEAIDQVQANLNAFEQAQEAKNGELNAEDQRLDQAIQDEASTARAAEEQLEQDLAAEVSRADAAEKANAKAIEDEAARADAEEKRIVGLVEAEVERARKQEGLLQDAIDAEEEAREQADTALDNRLKAVEASIGDGGNLEARVQANEDKLAGLEKDTVQAAIDQAEADAKAHAEQKIADLVDSAPDAMNTLNELAKAINDNKGIYDAYIEEHAQAMAQQKADLQAEIDADVLVEKNRAEGQEAAIRGEFADADAALKSELQAEIDADVKVEADRAKGVEAELLAAINKEVEDRGSAIDGLAERHDQEMDAVEGRVAALEALHTGDNSVENQIAKAKQDALDAVADEKERAEGQEAAIRQELANEKSALQKEIDDDVKAEADLREAADNALDGRLDVIEGEGEGSIKKAVADEAALRLAADQAIQKQLDEGLITVAFDGDTEYDDLAAL